MKHVVLIIDSLVGAGAEKTNIRLAELFISKGINVTLIVIKNIFELKYNNKINTVCLNYKKNKVPSKLRDLYYAKKLSKVLNTLNKPSLIIGSLGLTHKLMNIIDKKHNFFYALHGSTTIAKLKNKNCLNKYLKKKELFNTYNNKNIICVSNGVKKDILSLKIKPKSINVFYNPFNINEIIKKSNEKTNYSFSFDYIIHIGRFSKVKRHDILINAFSKIKNKDIKLILVGEGEERKNIEVLIKKLNLEEKVILTGFVDNPFPLLKNAQLLVLSSENEGFGNVLVESLILETNIVSTYTLGAQDIMKGDLQKQMCKVNDSKDLSNKIEYALQNNLSLKKYYQNFKEDNIFNSYNNLFIEQ